MDKEVTKPKAIRMCIWHGQAQPVRDAEGHIVGYVCQECRDPHSGGMIIKEP